MSKPPESACEESCKPAILIVPWEKNKARLVPELPEDLGRCVAQSWLHFSVCHTILKTSHKHFCRACAGPALGAQCSSSLQELFLPLPPASSGPGHEVGSPFPMWVVSWTLVLKLVRRRCGCPMANLQASVLPNPWDMYRYILYFPFSMGMCYLPASQRLCFAVYWDSFFCSLSDQKWQKPPGGTFPLKCKHTGKVLAWGKLALLMETH